jgi:hypothetical protein
MSEGMRGASTTSEMGMSAFLRLVSHPFFAAAERSAFVCRFRFETFCGMAFLRRSRSFWARATGTRFPVRLSTE